MPLPITTTSTLCFTRRRQIQPSLWLLHCRNGRPLADSVALAGNGLVSGADRPAVVSWTLEFTDGSGTAALGSAHRPVQPCRIWTPHLKQPGLSPTELVGAHPRNSGLHRSLGLCPAHGRTDRADLAQCESWIIGRCVRPARLSAAHRLAGTTDSAHSSGPAQPVAVWNSVVRINTGGLSSGRELGWTRRRIRWRDACGGVRAKRGWRPLTWINPSEQLPPE